MTSTVEQVARDCPRAGKLFGCKFRPRYSVQDAMTPSFDFLAFSSTPPPRPTPRKSRYVRDVCERCGRTIERIDAALAEGEGR